MSANDWPCPNRDLNYEKGENRRKHSGRGEAQMVFSNGLWRGECPKGFSVDVAKDLVQNGVPEFRSTTSEKPYRIWNYYDGVIYAARSQDGGKTWHGYPNGHPMYDPPRDILKVLKTRAKNLGEEHLIKKWLNTKWPMND